MIVKLRQRGIGGFEIGKLFRRRFALAATGEQQAGTYEYERDTHGAHPELFARFVAIDARCNPTLPLREDRQNS
jgi:hypothetical protein